MVCRLAVRLRGGAASHGDWIDPDYIGTPSPGDPTATSL